MNPWTLTPDQVVEEAKRLASRQEPPHWSELSLLLARIDRDQLYAPLYGTLRSFALAELEMAPDDAVEYLRLFRLLEAGLPSVRYEDWLRIVKARALVVLAAVRLGANVHAWYEKALAAESAKELDDELRRLTGKEERWARFELDVPASLLEVIEAAFTVAIPHVYPGEGLEVLTDRTKRPGLLECVCAHVIACPAVARG